MKKIALALGLFAATVAVAGVPRLDDSINDLNTAVSDLLKPYQTDTSKSEVVFTDLKSDDTNVLSTRLTATYQRVGKVQTLGIRVAGITWDFANGSPVVNVAGDASFDLTQVFQQEQLNGIVESAESLVEDLASNYTKDYGTAAQVKATMIERTKDANGNYTGFRASVALRLDLSKLPEGKKSEDIPLQSAVVFLNVNLTKGIALDGTVLMNPAYKNYGALRTGIEKLLARDADAGKKITDAIAKLDKMAGNLVDARVKQ